MKLLDAVIFSVALALIVVGIHQTMVNGIGFSYSLFMFAAGLLFWFQLRRTKGQVTTGEAPKTPKFTAKSPRKR